MKIYKLRMISLSLVIIHFSLKAFPCFRRYKITTSFIDIQNYSNAICLFNLNYPLTYFQGEKIENSTPSLK